MDTQLLQQDKVYKKDTKKWTKGALGWSLPPPHSLSFLLSLSSRLSQLSQKKVGSLPSNQRTKLPFFFLLNQLQLSNSFFFSNSSPWKPFHSLLFFFITAPPSPLYLFVFVFPFFLSLFFPFNPPVKAENHLSFQHGLLRVTLAF